MAKTTRNKAPAPQPNGVAAAAGAGAPLDYRIVIGTGDRKPSKLKSPLLDAHLHPGGAAMILVGGFLGGDDESGGSTAVDAFQIDSIVDYLRRQAEIRGVLEREIAAYFARNEPKLKLKPDASLWKRVKVNLVEFSRKSVMTRARFEGMRRLAPKLDEKAFDRLVEVNDKPETRSNFKLYFAGPWVNEHEHAAQFRDGRFVSFSIQ
jgi:hypothetical protein